MYSTCYFTFNVIYTDKFHLNSHFFPAIKASREVANLTDRKNPHTPAKNCNFMHFYELLGLQKTSYISKISAPFAAWPVFSALFTMCASSKNIEMGF